VLQDTWTFNGKDWTQMCGACAPPVRADAVMATLGSDVVLFGGYDGSSFLQDTWTFNGTSWTQASVSSPPPARAYAMMATLP
jgi:hypothetical protein